ncbi:MAG: hypothetical protein IPO43_15775 [Rhodoferax sp.]|nr:hypothetical protein [Rhodoferax sp.]
MPATYDPVTGTLTPNAPLAEGAHALTYTLTDAAGNKSPQSSPLNISIDTTARPHRPRLRTTTTTWAL